MWTCETRAASCCASSGARAACGKEGGEEEEEEKEEAEGALVGMGAVSVVMDIWCYLLNFEAAAGPEAAMGRPSER